MAAISAAALLLVPLAGPAAASRPDQADGVETFARDVFVVVGVSLRNPTADTDPSAQLFTSSAVALQVGDRFLTWGDWLAASATSRAQVLGSSTSPQTDVRLALHGLVPGGLYSVFWGTLEPDSEQPLCPNVERTLPLDSFPGAVGPTPNSFVADATGAMDFRGRAGGDLLAATQVFFTVVYHFFGQAPYPFPNIGELRTQGDNCRSSFGEDSMRQLIFLQKW